MKGRPSIYLGLVFWFFIGAFFLFPLTRLFFSGLSSLPEFPVFQDPLLWRIIRFTYVQALLSAVLSGVVGIFIAFAYSELRFPGRDLIWRWSLLCFSFPTVLVVLMLVAFWGKSGIAHAFIPRLYGWTGILIAHTFLNFALYTRYVGLALKESDRSDSLSALSLGASRSQAFWVTTFSKILPAIKSAFLLSFLYSASSFLVVLLLGGGPRFTTIEVGIYEATKIDFDLPLAVRLAAIQLFVSFTVYILMRWREEKNIPEKTRQEWAAIYRFRSKLGNSLWVGVLYLILALFVLGPILSLLFRSLPALSDVSFSDLFRVLGMSLRLALMVGVVTVLVALCGTYWEKHTSAKFLAGASGFAYHLPLAVSSLLLSLSLLWCFPSFHLSPLGGFLAAVIVQSMVALPVVSRSLHDGFSRIPQSDYFTAAALGATPWQRLWHLELPALKRSLFLGASLAMGFSLGDVGAILLFLSSENRTLPVWIYELMARYQFHTAYAVGGLLLIAMIALYWWLGRWEDGR